TDQAVETQRRDSGAEGSRPRTGRQRSTRNAIDPLTSDDRHSYGSPAPEGTGEPSRKGGIAHMSFLTALIASFRNDEEGQGLAEYALILALIAIVAIIALIFLGTQVSTILSKVGSSI